MTSDVLMPYRPQFVESYCLLSWYPTQPSLLIWCFNYTRLYPNIGSNPLFWWETAYLHALKSFSLVRAYANSSSSLVALSIRIHYFRLVGVPTVFTFQEVHVAVFFECDNALCVLPLVQQIIQNISSPTRTPSEKRDSVLE
jgi:hypothetical protein